MKHLLPTVPTVVLFALIALVCAGIASLSTRDEILVVFALPIFAVAAWLGMRHSGQWASLSRRAVEMEEGESDS